MYYTYITESDNKYIIYNHRLFTTLFTTYANGLMWLFKYPLILLISHEHGIFTDFMMIIECNYGLSQGHCGFIIFI